MGIDAVLLALVALAWLPANHYLPWLSAWQEGLALLALGLAALATGRRAILPAMWAGLLVVALASVAVQVFTKQILFAGDAWMTVLYLLALALALAVGSTLVGPRVSEPAERLHVLCLALLAAALVSAGIGFAQWAGVQRLGIFGADLPPGGRPFANFGQPNHWCTASLIGLAAAWVLFEARRLGGWTLGLVAAMLLMAMVVSGSRTAWLQLGLGAVIVVMLRDRAHLRLRPAPALAMLAAFALVWWLWPLLAGSGGGGGGVRSVAEQAQAGVRIPLWAAMLDAIALRPWTGYGWTQVTMAQQAVALEAPLHIHFEHAHNLLLDLMIWVGVPLALALIAGAAWALTRLVLATRDPRAAGLLLAVGGVLLHSMVEFAIEYAYFLVPMGLMLGAAHRLAGAPGWSVSAAATRGGACLLLGLLAVAVADYQHAEENYRTLRLESARVGTDRIDSTAPDLRALTQLEAFLAYARTPPKSGATAEEIASKERVVARFAYLSAQFRLAQWQALNGQPQAAGATLRLMCSMHAPALCKDALETWKVLQADQPLFQRVELPPPRP